MSTPRQDKLNFNLAIEGEVTLRREGEMVVIDQKLIGRRGVFQIGEHTGVIKIPAAIFKNEEQLRTWFHTAFNTYNTSVIHAVLHEALLRFGDVANETLDTQKIEHSDRKELVNNHIRETTKRIREELKISEHGHYSPWTKYKLTNAVRRSLRALPKSERTYGNVASLLKNTHGEQAPASGESLRQLMRRFEVDWKTLKADTEITSTQKDAP